MKWKQVEIVYEVELTPEELKSASRDLIWEYDASDEENYLLDIIEDRLVVVFYAPLMKDYEIYQIQLRIAELIKNGIE